MRGSIFKCVYINGKIIEFNSDCSIQAGFCFVFAVFGRNDFLFCLLKSVKWHFMRQFLCLSELRLRLNCMPHCHHASLQSSNQLIINQLLLNICQRNDISVGLYERVSCAQKCAPVNEA